MSHEQATTTNTYETTTTSCTSLAPAGPVAAKPHAKRLVLKMAKLAILLVVLCFVGRAMARQFTNVPWGEVQIQTPLFLLATVAYSLASFFNAVAYWFLLGGFARPPSIMAMCIVHWLPNLGKYVPGKFASVAGAVWLLNRYRIPTSTAASVVLLHHGLGILVGMIVSLPLCFWQPIQERFPQAWIYCIVGMGAGIVALHPRIVGLATNTASRIFRYPPLGQLPPWRSYLPPIALQALAWGTLGISTWLTARAMTPVDMNQLPIFTAAMALASSLGVLSLLPGGLVIREGILLVVLTPLTGSLTAMIVIVLRLLQIVVEVLLACVGLVLLRHGNCHVPADESESPANA